MEVAHPSVAGHDNRINGGNLPRCTLDAERCSTGTVAACPPPGPRRTNCALGWSAAADGVTCKAAKTPATNSPPAIKMPKFSCTSLLSSLIMQIPSFCILNARPWYRPKTNLLTLSFLALFKIGSKWGIDIPCCDVMTEICEK